MKKIIILLSFFIYSLGFSLVQVVKPQGVNYFSQGVFYGAELSGKLHENIGLLKKYYIGDNNVPYSKLVEKADSLFFKLNKNIQDFIIGESLGAKITIDDAKILNAMETFGGLINSSNTRCVFAYAGPNISKSKKSIIGRNYDYPEPFDKISKNLVINVLKEKGKNSTAIISMAGQIYCPSCINDKGIFIELNNGSPSGGEPTVSTNKTMLDLMLESLQNFSSISEVLKYLYNEQSDYSLIVNIADQDKMATIEFSENPSLGSKYKKLNLGKYVVTNYFTIDDWGILIAKLTDATTWNGVTRKSNLDKLLLKYSNHLNLNNFMDIFDKNIKDGGAVWDLTIYQIIYDTKNKNLYIKQNKTEDNSWQRFNLDDLFAT